MSESNRPQYLQIIGGVLAGAVALAVLGRMYMDVQKPSCREILKGDMPPPCLNVNRDKPRKTTVEPSQKGSNAEQGANKGIPPSVNAAGAVGLTCVTPARQKTPKARCEEPKAGGEPAEKPCDKNPKQVQKPPKTIAKPDFQTVEETVPKPCHKLPRSSWEYILKAQLKAREKLLPFGCGESMRKPESISRPCPEPEVPKEKIVKKVSNKKKCVSIDPAKRRWPLVGNSASAPNADSKYEAKCTCEPISPGRRRA